MEVMIEKQDVFQWCFIPKSAEPWQHSLRQGPSRTSKCKVDNDVSLECASKCLDVCRSTRRSDPSGNGRQSQTVPWKRIWPWVSGRAWALGTCLVHYLLAWKGAGRYRPSFWAVYRITWTILRWQPPGVGGERWGSFVTLLSFGMRALLVVLVS